MSPDPRVHSLLAELPAPGDGQESFETLLMEAGLRLQRIVSVGLTEQRPSPPVGWYDQEEDEWVLVVQGAAKLAFEASDTMTMRAGDYVHIPAHCRHRVVWTSPGEVTVWLALHFPPGAGP